MVQYFLFGIFFEKYRDAFIFKYRVPLPPVLFYKVPSTGTAGTLKKYRDCLCSNVCQVPSAHECIKSVDLVNAIESREDSITTIPPITITITHPCNRFSITIISPCYRHDYDYDYDDITSPKLKNDFVTACTKSELIKK